jgi:hypothetical protein
MTAANQLTVAIIAVVARSGIDAIIAIVCGEANTQRAFAAFAAGEIDGVIAVTPSDEALAVVWSAKNRQLERELDAEIDRAARLVDAEVIAMAPGGEA